MSGETKVIAYEVVDIGSPEPHVRARLRIAHRGRLTNLTLNVPGIRRASENQVCGVDLQFLQNLVSRLGAQEGGPLYDERFDIAPPGGDGVINVSDLLQGMRGQQNVCPQVNALQDESHNGWPLIAFLAGSALALAGVGWYRRRRLTS